MRDETRKKEFKKLLSRQAQRLRPAREWLVANRIGTFESVLEVGCGFGDVLKEFSRDHYCVGLDNERNMLKDLPEEGVLGDGHFLPFQDDSFDLMYCHLAVLWFKEPVKVVREMARVAKNIVCCMAEYDYGARLDFPDDFQVIRDELAEGILADGGDPFVGRKLKRYFQEAGLRAEVGAYSHVMTQEELSSGFEDEWKFIEQFTDMDEHELNELKEKEYESIQEGTRFLFTPVFYAVAHK